MSVIYLDYNATTPVAPRVVRAMTPYWSDRFGNASSAYSLGHASRAAIEQARQNMAQLLGCLPQEIVFTSGGTESNNLALRGVAAAWRDRSRSGAGHLVVSAVEHPAVRQPAEHLRTLGHDLTICGCHEHGLVDPDAIEAMLRPDTMLVSIMHANNEVGTIQPIREIARRCHARGILVHTDACQSVGKIPVDVRDLEVDLLAIAGHKLYAPKGIGALYVREGVPLDRVLLGAGQERGLSPGTEPVPLIVGLGEAALLATETVATESASIGKLRDELLARLREGFGEQLVCHAADAPRLPNTLSISIPGVRGSELLQRVPELCASTGAACHSGDISISATLQAMRVPHDIAAGTIRLSLGRDTTEADILRGSQLLIEACGEVTGVTSRTSPGNRSGAAARQSEASVAPRCGDHLRGL